MRPDCIDHGRQGLPKLPYALQRHLGKCRYMHRIAYIKHHGLTIEDIDGKQVRHDCDNPRCINPLHLLLGTNADNMKDKALRGRAPCKLDATAIADIRSNCVTGSREYGQRIYAIKYGVDQSHISRILSRHHRIYLP